MPRPGRLSAAAKTASAARPWRSCCLASEADRVKQVPSTKSGFRLADLVPPPKSQLTGESARVPCETGHPSYRKVRSAFRRACREVGPKAACDFVHQLRDGRRHAADFLIVEHHLLG